MGKILTNLVKMFPDFWQLQRMANWSNIRTKKFAFQVITSVQTVLTCSRLVSPQAMTQVVKFLYTGTIDTNIVNIGALKQVRKWPKLISNIYLTFLS